MRKPQIYIRIKNLCLQHLCILDENTREVNSHDKFVTSFWQLVDSLLHAVSLPRVEYTHTHTHSHSYLYQSLSYV